MTRIVLRIEADLCGPLSMGTVAVIRCIARHVQLPLAEANELVDRCVFDAEQITLRAPSRTAAEALLAAFSELPAAARIHASIIE